MFVIKTHKSSVVDEIILNLEERLRTENKHLLKTSTIFSLCKYHINLTDEIKEREELLEIGMRQVIQSRLYAHGYFSVDTGFFVNEASCTDLEYLGMIIAGKDDVIKGKIAARNRIKELKQLDGQMEYVPDENNALILTENKTREQIIADLEADAI